MTTSQLFRGQRRDGATHEVLDFVLLDRIERRRGIDDQALVVRLQRLGAATATTDAVAVLRDHRPQPWHERPGLAHGSDVLVHGEKRLLSGVLRQVKVPRAARTRSQPPCPETARRVRGTPLARRPVHVERCRRATNYRVGSSSSGGFLLRASCLVRLGPSRKTRRAHCLARDPNRREKDTVNAAGALVRRRPWLRDRSPPRQPSALHACPRYTCVLLLIPGVARIARVKERALAHATVRASIRSRNGSSHRPTALRVRRLRLP